MNDWKLPDKLTFRRNEVVKITKLNGKVIDYWEQEFKAYKPNTNQAGEIFYTRKDLENILAIKHMLINEKKSKQSVREYFNQGVKEDEVAESKGGVNRQEGNSQLKIVKQVLKEILTILNKNVTK